MPAILAQPRRVAGLHGGSDRGLAKWRACRMSARSPIAAPTRAHPKERFVPISDSARSKLPREDFSGSAGICLLKVGDDDLLHLHHGLHGPIGLFAIGIAQITAEGSRYNLPGQAELVLEPSAFRFLTAVGGQSVPEIVHLFLAL